MSDQRYRVVIGLSISKEEQPGFSDNGIVYHNMKYDQMVQVQELFARHSNAMLDGMTPLIEDLVAIGKDETVKRMGQVTLTPSAAVEHAESKDIPGAIR